MLKEYFAENCGLDQMDLDNPKEEDSEEEKIETSSVKPKGKVDPNLIPTALYLLTPDFYFTLPKFCKTLEELTKTYYLKK